MFFGKYFRTFFSILSCIAASQSYAKNNEYSVLAYHSVIDETSAEKDKFYLPQTIPASMLIEQFNWLKSNGYNVVSWQQVIDAENGTSTLPDKAVLLSFDDGYETMYSVIYPLLKAYNYTAVFAPVTSWLNAPLGTQIQYGSNAKLPREAFASWAQVAEMRQSGLVEIASHTNDLHYGAIANPGGSQIPAIITPFYKNGKYETESEYQSRVLKDLQISVNVLTQKTGKAPRVMVWPYGQFNDSAVQIANKVGLTHHFSLDSKKINKAGDKHVGRLLLDAETSITTISDYLEQKTANNQIQRVVHIDLDYVYDSNPEQQKKNFDTLIERIHAYGVNTVYLQAYADQDGNGVADALYFPNKYLPVKADLFSQVAWQLRSRANVKVYAWMPVLAFDLRNSGKNYQYITDTRTGVPSDQHYLRLSPFDKQNKEVIKSIYRDLSFYSKFDGILFHDDAFLTDFEISDNAKQKTADLIQFTHELKNSLAPYFIYGKNNIKTSRNIYASLITTPNAENWFAQNFVEFTKNYDTTAIMAMPYMENEKAINEIEALDWMNDLIQKVKDYDITLNKVLFEFQTINWRNKNFIPETELINWIKLLEKNNIYSFGYYPDNFLLDKPNIQIIKPYISINQDSTRK